MTSKMFKITGYILLATAFIVLAVVAYQNNQRRQTPVIFSSKDMIESLWRSYKDEYLEKGSYRTLDRSQNNLTTSEGQSYTMLRAVWLNDRDAFDKSWSWTRDNLQHSDDSLFAWLYGEMPDGTYGIMTDRGGENSASDADIDIALALVMASQRWDHEEYLMEAKEIISDIWDEEVISINGTLYLAANDIENENAERIIVNPSYTAPYAYRIFAEVDPDNDWMQLVDDSYDFLAAVMRDPLDKNASVNIPPDWAQINRRTGQIEAANGTNLTSNYSFDAMRLPWRLALDWQWNREDRAQGLLRSMSFFNDQWMKENVLYASYSHDGQVMMDAELPAMYGGIIGYFMAASPEAAQDVYTKKLVSLYNPDTNNWKLQLSYYDDNWAWFGIALYNQYLVNIYALQ